MNKEKFVTWLTVAAFAANTILTIKSLIKSDDNKDMLEN